MRSGRGPGNVRGRQIDIRYSRQKQGDIVVRNSERNGLLAKFN